MNIVVTGGGSGGHIMPLVALIRELKKQVSDASLAIHYLGPRKGGIMIQHEGCAVHAIVAGKVRRYIDLRNVIDIVFLIPYGFLQSIIWLLVIRPRMVFSKGGSGSLVVCCAAWILGIPVWVHESDTVTGRSNRVAAVFAQKIYTSFPVTKGLPLKETVVVGNPIRASLLDDTVDLAMARSTLGITTDKPVLLFSGGSQGAETVNDLVLDALPDLLESYEVIHSSGNNNYKRVALESQIILRESHPQYHLFDSLDEIQMKCALTLASVVIARAGGNIFEIAAFGKPSILIPLPTAAQNHQVTNAYQYASTGAAIVMEQQSLTPHFFIERVRSLLESDTQEKMRSAALQFARPQSAVSIAGDIATFLGL